MATEATPNSVLKPPLSRRYRSTTIILVFLALAGYGLRELYEKVIVWPKEMRTDLRAAIKAKNNEDYKTAVYYYRKGLNQAKGYENPMKELGKNYRIKISGLMIALASALEEVPDIAGAIQVYEETVAYLSSPSSPVSSTLGPAERHRIISIAVRIGELASKTKDTATEERYLTLAAEEALRIARDLPSKVDSGLSGIDDQDERWSKEMKVPPWVDQAELGSVLERLAEFYGGQDNLALAVPLYMQAISFLMLEDKAAGISTHNLLSILRSSNVSVINRCRAAQLMTNVASLFANARPNAVVGNADSADMNHLRGDRSSHAKAWASRALELVQKAMIDLPAKDKEGVAGHECGVTLAHSLHSMGMLSEDGEERRLYLERSLAEARKVGFREGVEAARVALRRLE